MKGIGYDAIFAVKLLRPRCRDAERGGTEASSARAGRRDQRRQADHAAMRRLVNLLAVEDYTNKYKVCVVVRIAPRCVVETTPRPHRDAI